MKKTTRVLGIDPGYDRVGWAIADIQTVHNIKLLEYGSITTTKKTTLSSRYLDIDAQLTSIILTHKPEKLAIEKVFFAQNTTTALQVAEARGVILSCSVRHKLSLAEYAPNQIKLAAAGHGTASKADIKKMVQLQLKPSRTNLLDDTYDALAILITDAVLG